MRENGGGGEHAALRRAVARQLSHWQPPLELLAERVLGLAARIDWVTRAPDGQVWLVALAASGEDLARFTDLLAQRSWLASRLPDWAQLAPERAIATDRPPGGLLLAREFDPRAEQAALALGDPDLRLGRVQAGPGDTVQLVPLEPPLAGSSRARFRSHLRTEELAVPASLSDLDLPELPDLEDPEGEREDR